MTHLTMRKFKAEDLIMMEVLEIERKRRNGRPVAVWAEIHEKTGPAYTFIDDEGRTVFCCGVDILWPGVGEAWACFSPLAERYPHVLQCMKWVVKEAFPRWGLWRLQAILAVDDDAAIRMDERLGFKRESVLRRYGSHGEDRYMYAIVKED